MLKQWWRRFQMFLDRLPSGRNKLLCENALHGRWRLYYHRFGLSQRFFYDVATDYQELFGGDVVWEPDVQKRYDKELKAQQRRLDENKEN